MQKQDRKPVRLARPGGDTHTELYKAARIIVEKEVIALYPDILMRCNTYDWAREHAPEAFQRVRGLENAIDALWSDEAPFIGYRLILCCWMHALLAMYEARWQAGQGEELPAGSPHPSPRPSLIPEESGQSSLFEGSEAS